MERTRRGQEGMALLLAILAAAAILAAISLVTAQAQHSKRLTDEAYWNATLEEACRAGIDVAVARIWNDYVTGNGNTTGNLASYRVFADRLVGVNEDLDGDGSRDDNETDANGNGQFDIASPLNLLAGDEPLVLAGGARVVGIAVSRTDDVTGVNYTMRVTGQMSDSGGARQRTAVQTVRVAGQRFDGFQYAVLANNINCILCHARVLPQDMRLNTDPALYGSFDRVKVASLESLMVRTTENVGSRVAGTVYSRGIFCNEAGTTMTAAQISSSTFKGNKFSQDNGKIVQNGSGAMTDVALQNASSGTDGKLEQFANLYLNYPDEQADMTDGTLPGAFPAPFPDEDGDRAVSDAEFQSTVNSANGSISFELDPGAVGGSITAGVAYGVPDGATYSGSSLPAGSNSALNQLSSTGSYDGNLILVGTSSDPIVIHDKVAINGDLVIKGPVKGWGQLLVRGNVYVVGDVTYADASGKFGEAADGTDNALAVTAGGSILIGDYLTIRGKNNTNDTAKFPDKAGSINVRQSTASKTLKVGTKSQTVKIGYFDTNVVDAGAPVAGQTQYSFTTSELMLFNRMEKAKADADPTYRPRYYRLRPSQPIYTYTASDEHAVKYDDSGVAVISNLANATILNLCPDNFWLSEDQLRHFWYTDEMSRPDSGRPFQFDGLLYCNNSIFCITRSKCRHNSNMYGRMDIRGAVVCADLGVLTPGEETQGAPRQAFYLYYDRRVADFLRVEDVTQVQFSRVAFRWDAS